MRRRSTATCRYVYIPCCIMSLNSIIPRSVVLSSSSSSFDETMTAYQLYYPQRQFFPRIFRSNFFSNYLTHSGLSNRARPDDLTTSYYFRGNHSRRKSEKIPQNSRGIKINKSAIQLMTRKIANRKNKDSNNTRRSVYMKKNHALLFFVP